MVPADPQFARSDVLRDFNHSEVYLLLGASITTIGLLAGCFSLLRRRVDPLLLWFALFAILYGVRLDLGYQLLWALDLHPLLLQRVTLVIQCLIPIPAFFFFSALNLSGGRARILSTVVWPVAISLAVASLFLGHRELVQVINNVFVVTALLAVIISFVRFRADKPDIVLMRRGLLVFIACTVFDNITGLLGHFYNIEPFSFLILLACLGVVAGRRALAGEQQLTNLQKELEIAQGIQLSILPAAFPVTKNFRVAARYLPMTTVAGDFYDFLLANDTELGILVADVSGHGVPAALIASMVKLAAVSQRARGDCPSELLTGMNDTLIGNTQRQFVTAGYVYLNAVSQEFRYAAAGHPPMLLLREGKVTAITENGMPLALFKVAAYETLGGSLQSGDRLVLYTDGVLEAANRQLEEFGEERLHALVRASGAGTATEAADRIVAAIQQWSPAQGDDVTVVVCDYLAAS